MFELKVFIIPSSILGLLGIVGVLFLPENILLESVNYISRFVFPGGITLIAVWGLFDKIRGNTKILLLSKSLTDIERLRLSMAIKRRSSFLWHLCWQLSVAICLCNGLIYLHSKELFQPYLLYTSFVVICMTFPFMYLVYISWRDYQRAQEILDTRNANIPDS